jgi:hypothetical protein
VLRVRPEAVTIRPPSGANHSMRTLLQADVGALEEIYRASEHPLEIPRGMFRGTTLARLDNRAARAPFHRSIQWLLFEAIPWGIDFDANKWFFFRRDIAAGSFIAQPARSRWRDARVLTLEYHPSRLPGPIRTRLYDEVRPLGPDLCLGIGGINEGKDEGDHFFFALERVDLETR